MKVGDSFICIKHYEIFGTIIFRKDKIYNVVDIDKELCRIWFYGNDGDLYWFRIDDIERSIFHYRKYFESIKEIRKKKLDRLNENR